MNNEAHKVDETDDGVPTLQELLGIPGVTQEVAEKVRAVLTGEISAYSVSEDARIFDRTCVHRPNPNGYEVKLIACAELLGLMEPCALEIEDADQYTDEGIRMCPPFTYCNPGDSYVVTLARDHQHGRWVVGCWADLAEQYEKDHKIGDFEEFDEEPESCPSCGMPHLKLESFPRGAWAKGPNGMEFFENGRGYNWICQSCGHPCLTAPDFEPPEDSEVEL